MDRLFAPRGVAVVGANPDRGRPGGRVWSYLTENGFRGKLYPVSRGHDSIAGVACYPSVVKIPGPVDLAMLCVPANAVVEVVRECAQAEVQTALVYANGLSPEDLDTLASLRRDTGIRIIGPNSVGVRAAHIGLFAEAGGSLGAMGHTDGPIAMIGQSGGLVTYFGSTFPAQLGCGVRYVLDTGNEVDVDSADMLDLVCADPEIVGIALVIEGAKNGRKLADSIRRASDNGKTVVVLRLGKTAAGAAAAISHTGTLAGSAEVFEQITKRSGAIVCGTPGELSTALVLAARGVRRGRGGLGVVTPSGGFAVLAHDLAERCDVELPIPSAPAAKELTDSLGHAAYTNPIDINLAPSASPTQSLGAALTHMLAQPNLQSVLTWLPYQLSAPDQPRTTLEALLAAGVEAKAAGKSLMMCGRVTAAIAAELHAVGITAFEKPEDFFGPFGMLTAASESHASDRHIPERHIPDRHSDGEPTADREQSQSVGADDQSRHVLTGPAAEQFVASAGVAFVNSAPITSVDEAVQFAGANNDAIYLKVEARGLAHKSDVGAVAGPLTTAEEIAAAWPALAEVAASQQAATVVAQAAARGTEMVVSAFRDASFGPVVMVGAGGTLVEWKRDVAFARAPVTEAEAAQLLAELDSYPLLTGYRGRPPGDIAALAQQVAAVSRLVASADAAVYEVELNPVLVADVGAGAVAVDCVVVCDLAAQEKNQSSGGAAE